MEAIGAIIFLYFIWYFTFGGSGDNKTREQRNKEINERGRW